jgi:dolichol-phosphate mannosyltransferase
MRDEALALPSSSPDTPLHRRVAHGMRKPENWAQLVRFGVVGGSGYAVNLAAYAVALHVAGLDYRVSAVVAFLVAVTNNFLWNRRWTFRVRTGRRSFQAARFLAVSVVTFLVTLGILTALVELAGVAEVPAQAIAVIAGLPLNFLGQKLWSFRS